MTKSVMQAALLEAANAPFRIAEIARPMPGPGEVLVRIKASGVNPLDTKIRVGAAPHARQPLPAVLGIDLAGTVEALGEGVSDFVPGDDVYGMAGGVGGHQGTLAQYAAVDARLLARLPKGFTMREAAALPLVFTTAWEGLVDRARVSDGQKVLIHGGAGGVGHVAVQIAKAFGADVCATGNADQFETIRRLGAVPVDYRNTIVDAYVREHTGANGFDIVFDTVGGANLDKSFEAIGRFGHVVSALGWGTHALAPLSFKAGTYSGVFTLLPLQTGEGREHHGEIMREATRLAESGLLQPMIDQRLFDLESVGEAHDLVASGRAHGKVVVEVA